MTSVYDLPMAAPGLTSYRYPSTLSKYIMIGATDHEDALAQAFLSLTWDDVNPDLLEVWDGEKYVPAYSLTDEA